MIVKTLSGKRKNIPADQVKNDLRFQVDKGWGNVLVALGRGPQHRRSDTLLKWACQETSLEDFGKPIFLEGFRTLHQSFKESGLHARGWRIVEKTLYELLKSRLQIEAFRKAHPLLTEQKIESPLFIIGMPRTGTTFLHRLLSVGPRLRALKIWEMLEPCPPSSLHPEVVPERRARAQSWCDHLYDMVPALKPIHYTEADSPEECIYLLRNTFVDTSFTLQARLSSYRQWLNRMDMEPIYRDYRQQLQMLQLGSNNLRLLLKSPNHSHHVEDILTVFPDACFLRIHRHPAEAIPSAVNLRRLSRAVYSERSLSNDHVRQRIESWKHLIPHLDRFAGTLPGNRYLDVCYKQLVKDPLAEARNIYQYFGIEWDGLTEKAMTKWLKDNPKGRFGSHQYDSRPFDVSLATIEDTFAEYVKRYQL
ncbi:MAG: sulfotransferase [Planctomycetaceae bacterium]|nr:sulfotransferase [Planctomycetaceae bacterium]